MFSLKIRMCFTEISKMKTYTAWLPIPTPRSFPKQVVSISFSTWFPFALARVYDKLGTTADALPAACQGQNAALAFLATEEADKRYKTTSCSIKCFHCHWMKKTQTNNGKGCHSLSLVFNKLFFIILSLLLQIGAILWSSLFLFSGDTRARRD